MTTITVTAHYPQPPERVWDELRHLERHVTWMKDARRIAFDGDQRAAVGTTFRVVTRVGPLTTTDRMTINRWEEGRAMGVEHHGLVTGVGCFTLEPDATGTAITWEESLVFPWWLAGRLGERLAVPVLRRLWATNLGRLGALLT